VEFETDDKQTARFYLYTATWDGAVNEETGKPEGFGSMRYKSMKKTQSVRNHKEFGRTNVELVPSHIYKGNFGTEKEGTSGMKQGQGLTVDISPEGKISSNGFKPNKKNCLIFWGNHDAGHRESGWDGAYLWNDFEKQIEKNSFIQTSAIDHSRMLNGAVYTIRTASGEFSTPKLTFQIEGNPETGVESWERLSTNSSMNCVRVSGNWEA
jgi:hypothetical protein